MSRVKSWLGVLRQLFVSPYFFQSSWSHPFLRFVHWQIKKKIGHKTLIFTLPGGYKLMLKNGQQNASGYYYYGLPDFVEQSYLINNIEEGDLFVDVGANAGGWSFIAAGYGADVIAIEPVESTFSYLKENSRLNAPNNIRLERLAVGESIGEVRISNDLGPQNKIILENRSSSESVKLVNLDFLLSGQNPSFIKIDTEGYELAVLKGARNTLKKSSLKALIIEDWRAWREKSKNEASDIDKLLFEYGFFPVSYNPKLKTISYLDSKNEGLNTIFAKRVSS